MFLFEEDEAIANPPKLEKTFHADPTDSGVPMFSLDRVQFSFPGVLIDLTVGNNLLAMALESSSVSKEGTRMQQVLRIDLGQSQAIEEIEFAPKQKNDKIRRLFMDPTARHLIITTNGGDNYYLYYTWKKPRNLAKFRGVLIESIAWGKPRSVNDISTGVMLVGSKQGHIYEAELQPSEDFFKKEERLFKQIYSAREERMPICGLKYFVMADDPRRYILLACTPNKVMEFVGTFSDYGDAGVFSDLARLDDRKHGVFDTSRGIRDNALLTFWSPFADDGFPILPKKFAWINEKDVICGAMKFDNWDLSRTVFLDSVTIPYSVDIERDDDATKNLRAPSVPISGCVSEFHIILLYEDRVKAICDLNGKLVYEEYIPLEAGEKVLGMTLDSIKNTFWIFTSQSLFELLITEEDRNIWKIYLKRHDFDAALSYSKTEQQRDEIVTSRAELYFNSGEFLLAALYFAQSQSRSFEDTCLRFIEKNQTEALKQYLLKKLEKLRKYDIAQSTMICMWYVILYCKIVSHHLTSGVSRLLEIFIDKINAIKTDPNKIESSEDKAIREEFRQFLKNYKDKMDVQVTYKLLEGHGRVDELLYFAELITDFEKIFLYWVSAQRWDRALEVLSRYGSPDLYYKYSTLLLENAPTETVNAWIKRPNLNPRTFLPALMKYELNRRTQPDGQNQAIRYLNYVIDKLNNTDPIIHNYLLCLYVAQAREDKEEGLLIFLNSHKDAPIFELRYALRLCLQEGFTQSCMYIYSAMGLYEQAVDLALKHQDLDMARINADKPIDDDILRKKLWLKIARYVVEDRKDIKQAMNFLQSTDLLKIEDILPFFPDFAVIDDFKDELCHALEDYNSHLERLKAEMNEATKGAENIRMDIREQRNRSTTNFKNKAELEHEIGGECPFCGEIMIKSVGKPFIGLVLITMSVCEKLSGTTCYDLLPPSYKLIVLETSLLVKKALSALLQHGVQSAPLWNAKDQKFVGMFTVTDFINLLIHYDKFDDMAAAQEEIEKLTLASLKALGKDKPSLRMNPMKSLLDASMVLLDNGLHRLPLVDNLGNSEAIVSVVTQFNILRFIAINCEQLPHCDQSVKALGIGSYGKMETISVETPLVYVLNMFVNRRISAVPVVDEKGVVVDVYEKYDVLLLAKDGGLQDLRLPVSNVLTKRTAVRSTLM
ncbi:hypothetical protein HDU76_012696 [Blyttiomyces sp. JEL0837]|nr:hypothetical protein HDU76_012696 [Blyttiomyces sp. JEL0837]